MIFKIVRFNGVTWNMPPINPLFCGSTVSATYKGHNTTELAIPKKDIMKCLRISIWSEATVPKPNKARTISINTKEGDTASTIAAIMLIIETIKIA